MRIRRSILLGVPLAAILLQGCRHTPEGVLGQEEMALLMADTYMGEGVVDMDGGTWSTDSSRIYLRESIYKAHGLTRADVDRSFDYYGNHIEDYIKVLDRTQEILVERQKSLSAASSRQLSISGDSVDIWSGPHAVNVNSRIPSRYITFSVTPDSTWHKGDSYELRYKLVNSNRPVETHVFVDYSEGVTRQYDTDGRGQGFTSLRFVIDSTLTPTRLYGYIDLNPMPNVQFHIDSISMVRTRMGRDFFMSRGREYLWNKKHDYRHRDEVPADSTSEIASNSAAPKGHAAPPSTTTRELPPATIGASAVGTIRRPR